VIELVVEEALGDRPRRAGVDLGLEKIEVGVEVAAVGMLLGIGGDRDLDVGVAALDAGDQVGR
jgi:hypothetical protein